MDGRSRLRAWVIAGAACVVFPSFARANAGVDEGRRLYDEAEFDRAIATLAQVLETNDLSRDELVRLLEIRVLAYHALGNQAATQLDLQRLASLDPTHTFGPEAPPELHDAFVAVGVNGVNTGLSIDVHVGRGQDNVIVTPTVRDDPTRLVTRVVAGVRPRGGTWRHAENEPTSLAIDDRTTVEYYALAIGPGGATVAERGSETEPLVLAPEAVVAPDDGGFPWFWTGTATLVVAAAATAVILFWPQPTTNDSQPGRPTVSW